MRRFIPLLLAAMLVLSSCARQTFPDLNSVSSLQGYLGQPEAEESEGRDLLWAWLYQLQPRAFPHDSVDWHYLDAAAAVRDRTAPAPGPARWEFIGPTHLPVPYRIYFGQGAINGRVNAVAFDTKHPGRLYLGAAGGGVWRSDDDGKSWQALSDGWPALQVSSLAVDGDTIIAGTGDFAYPLPRPSQGLLRSDDGGRTWGPCGPPELKQVAISRVLMDGDVVTLTTGRGMQQWGGIWQSRDGGRTFHEVVTTAAAWCDLAISQHWYFAVGYTADGDRIVLRSDDRGASWSECLRRAHRSTLPSLAALAVSPREPDRAWVLLGGLHQVLETRDGGSRWENVTGNFPDGGGLNWMQDWYDVSLCATADNVLYAGLIDLAQSPDGGSTWRSVGLTLTQQALTHNDQQAATVDPRDPHHVLIGSDGGAYHVRDEGGRCAFTSLNAGLGVTQIYAAAFHPTNPDVCLCGTQDNSSPCCRGSLAQWINVGGGDGGFCAINPRQPEVQYASSQFVNIWFTTNNWASQRLITPNFGSDRRAFIGPLALDPDHPDRLYAATNYLWRWDAAKLQWTPRQGNQPLSASGVVNRLAVKGSGIYTGSNM
ncbi:MAG: WD40/YVTN/BNR-like repeat-containing protein, partial [Candidatus Xenobia bacterium]